jgi:hypothetical protein
MRHAAAVRAEKFLQRECSDPQLRVKWDESINRFIVGRLVRSLGCDYVEEFMIVSDGMDGYRPIDMRTVRKIISLDTWRRKKMTKDDFVKMIEDRKTDDLSKKREILRYRAKHEARYIKKAAEKDGLI